MLGSAGGNFRRKDVGRGFFGRGVTLIELVVVIAILAFLAVMAVTNFNGQQMKARDARRKSDLERIRNFLEEYHNDNQIYPPYNVPVGWGMGPSICGVAGFDCHRALLSCKGQITLPKVYDFIFPCDPINTAPYLYAYDSLNNRKSFRIYARLENTKDPIIAQIGCTGGCPNGYSSFNYGLTSGDVGL
jgi:prepilin-type N-terminal cleavage/methylation domain-containing protein